MQPRDIDKLDLRTKLLEKESLIESVDCSSKGREGAFPLAQGANALSHVTLTFVWRGELPYSDTFCRSVEDSGKGTS